jgi:hypothetical protein
VNKLAHIIIIITVVVLLFRRQGPIIRPKKATLISSLHSATCRGRRSPFQTVFVVVVRLLFLQQATEAMASAVAVGLARHPDVYLNLTKEG